MTITAERLIDLLEEMDCEPYAYSGRAMFGTQCVAVNVDFERALSIGAELIETMLADADARAWASEGVKDCDADEFGLAESIAHDIVRLMGRARTDDMGRSQQVVYWPHVEWPRGDR